MTNPKLTVEVLSPSTAGVDRYEKRSTYQWISTLEEYATIAEDSAEVGLYRREDDWRPLIQVPPADTIEFRSIGLALPLTRSYDGASMWPEVDARRRGSHKGARGSLPSK